MVKVHLLAYSTNIYGVCAADENTLFRGVRILCGLPRELEIHSDINNKVKRRLTWKIHEL